MNPIAKMKTAVYEMRGFLWRWGVLTALVLLAALGCDAIVGMMLGQTNPFDRYPSWTVEKVESLIQHELPLGCERQEVEDWFDRHHIQHHYSQDMSAYKDAGPLAMQAGLKDSDLSGVVSGMISPRNTFHRDFNSDHWGRVRPAHAEPKATFPPLATGYISIYFFFDKDDHYIGHRVRPTINYL